MKTLYESILSSTGSGVKKYKPKKKWERSGDATYKIDLDMQKWFSIVDGATFAEIADKSLRTTMKQQNDGFQEDTDLGIFFKDGYFEMHFANVYQNMVFSFYFANEPKMWFIHRKEAREKQMNMFHDKQWVSNNVSIKTAALNVFDYIKKHLDKIIKQ